jgi:uncharacterized protein DUF6852/uncharacterized protein DUF5606
MSIKGIISISGQPGLFKVLTQTKTGFIVESLINKKRTAVGSTEKVSMLEDISIFTITDDIPLKDVLLKIKKIEAEHPVIPAKSDPKKLREYFKKVLPDYDEERVYTSDIKKVINWYGFVKDIIEEDAEEIDQEENTSQDDDGDDVKNENVDNSEKQDPTPDVTDENSSSK